MKNCSAVVSSFYSSFNSCVNTLLQISPLITGTTVCNTTFSSFVQQACYPPTCPDAGSFTALLPLANCLFEAPAKLQASGGDINSYNAYACLQSSQNTYGVPSQCQPGVLPKLLRF